MPDEETIWTGHPSHWHYFWAWVLGVVLFAAVIGIGIIIWIFIDRSRRTYIVTPTKVMTESGLWAKNSDEVRIKDIRSIAVRKSGLKGLLGVGDLEFSSAAAGDAEIIFSTIPRVTDVRDLVRRYQNEPA
jgi:uncharacterized membrane protein YdbT with pleckstrin-like domain